MKSVCILFITLFAFTYSNAQIVDIPDEEFKEALVSGLLIDVNGDGVGDANVDSNGDGEIQVSEAEVVIELNLGAGYYILSLEGIQSFINLEGITYLQNDLNDVDFSQNQSLRYVWFFGNSLTNIDVTQNPNLEMLNLGDNLLTNIDVSQNPNLRVLSLRDNELSSIDISLNSNLISLTCFRNQLTSLNIQNGNNINILSMLMWDNPNLFCIQVDDVEYSNSTDCGGNNSWCKDEWAVYSEECTLGIDENNFSDFTIYPNPLQNILFIESQQPIETVKLYNLQGQLIKEYTTNSVSVSQLIIGLYFIQVTIEGKTITKKFIKK